MNYQIIKNEKLLDEFIDWLPDLKKDNEDNEVFYMCLFARKKYFEGLISSSNDKTQLRRELVSKHSIKRELRKWECALGTYQLKKDTVPQEALAVYITPNPRSMKKAMFNHLKELAEFASKNNIPHNLHQNAISCVQGSKSYNYVVDFDIDTKDVDLNLLKEILYPESYNILETRGGYHILVKPNIPGGNYVANWYQKIQNTFSVDQAGDQMIPIAGCCQGNFIPKFIKI